MIEKLRDYNVDTSTILRKLNEVIEKVNELDERTAGLQVYGNSTLKTYNELDAEEYNIANPNSF